MPAIKRRLTACGECEEMHFCNAGGLCKSCVNDALEESDAEEYEDPRGEDEDEADLLEYSPSALDDDEWINSYDSHDGDVEDCEEDDRDEDDWDEDEEYCELSVVEQHLRQYHGSHRDDV